MKVTSIPKISGYRIFRSFTWNLPLEDFRRYNLIFGPNASGKTTLSCLFRLMEQKGALSPSDGVATFAFDGTNINASEFDQRPLPNVRVFNRDTAKRSVFEDMSGELPPVFYFGEDTAEKQKEIAEKRKQAATISEQITACRLAIETADTGFEAFCVDSARAVKNLLTASGSAYNNYDKSSFKSTAEKILKADKVIEPLKKLRRESLISLKGSAEKPQLPSISTSLPDFNALRTRVRTLLETTVASELIATLVNQPKVASWVSEGLRLHKDGDRCKFCDEPIPPDRLKRLEAHFNDRFRIFQADLDAALDEIERSRGLLEKATPSQAEFYDDMASEYAECKSQVDTAIQEASHALNVLQGAIRSKKGSPFNPMEIDWAPHERTLTDSKAKALFDFFTSAEDRLVERFGGAAIAACNTLIAAHNKRAGNHAREVADARRELEEDEVATRIKSYASRRERTREQQNKFIELQTAARQMQDEIAALEASVRTHQRPGQELTKEVAAYLGNSELTFEVKDTGYAIKRSGRPAMNLSEGERTAIAFLYFLKSLSDTNFSLKDGIVLIDDPVSSLDANSLYCAFGCLKAKCANAGQLFILTHNFTLFRLTREWFHHISPKDQTRFYMLGTDYLTTGRGAKIAPLDPLLREYESEYQYLFKCVVEGSSASTIGGDLASYYGAVNVARRVMEAFLAFKLPHLGPNLHRKLEEIPFDPAKKARILRFLNVGSHAGEIGEPEHDISILSETPAVLADLLEMIKSVDAAHHDGMRQKLGI
ncbi:MAG TPA: AAA family ATPase [Acidobacteriaceae bacterium]|nr:AAA family ATPase [Acidobacteriaceae bacterium]